MKKLMLLLALVGLVMGCAHDRNVGWAGDEDEMDSGSDMNSPTTSNMLNSWGYAPPSNSNVGR